MSENNDLINKNIFHLVVILYAKMIIFVLLCNVSKSKSQCIDASCHHALCCVIIMNPMTQSHGKIVWTRSYHIFGFIVIVRQMLMYQKIPIHYSWMNGILVFFKLTLSICFPSLFNYKAPIAICHVFLDALKIFSIESYHACLNITRVGKFFQNTCTRGYHVFMSMVTVKQLLIYQKYQYIIHTLCD